MNKKVASSCTWWFCKTCSIQCPLMIFYFWYQVYQISHKCILINHFKHHIKPRWCENTHIESYSYKTYLYNQSLKNKNQFALFHYFDFWNCISCVSEIYIRGVISIGCFLDFFSLICHVTSGADVKYFSNSSFFHGLWKQTTTLGSNNTCLLSLGLAAKTKTKLNLMFYQK